MGDVEYALANKAEMWVKLGSILANRAFKNARNEYSAQSSLEWARCAEACFWQATGDSEAIDLKDVLK